MNVHLVGSIGLDSVEEVFSTVGKLLGSRIKRVPDGEPGPRRLWVSFQYPFLRSSPYIRPDPSGEVRPTSKFPKLCLAEGVRADEVSFGELGYAREAKGSYQDFLAARERGELPKAVRFQVCLPTPMGVIYAFCTTRDLLSIEAAYEAAMIREVERICRAIPHRDLCVQWDFCHEMIILDGQPQDHFPLVKASMDDIMQRMKRICAAVPADVELGVHLCYGDFGAKHMIEPRDMSRMVEVANAMTAAVERPITYLHMPVPISRTDEAYFAPLKDLRFDGELYLGVVHAADGVEGTRKRMRVAAKYAPSFGIACECGIARARRSGLVKELLEIHAQAAA
jgi:methionine synthase II (cobalamin-independent)